MAKRGGAKLAAGIRVRVREGVTVPECPQFSADGWVGEVVEVKGRGSDQKVIVEWTDATIDSMPADYVQLCEQQGLYLQMACFTASDVETVEE